MSSKKLLDCEEEENNQNNNNSKDKIKNIIKYSDSLKTNSNNEKSKTNDSSNTDFLKIAQKLTDSKPSILQPTPHPLLVDSKNNNTSIKSSNDCFNESIFYKNENLNFNALTEKVIQFNSDYQTDRPKCKYDDNIGDERMQINYNNLKYINRLTKEFITWYI